MTELFAPYIGIMVSMSPKFLLATLGPKHISKVLICSKLAATSTSAQVCVPLIDYTVHLCSRTLY